MWVCYFWEEYQSSSFVKGTPKETLVLLFCVLRVSFIFIYFFVWGGSPDLPHTHV